MQSQFVFPFTLQHHSSEHWIAYLLYLLFVYLFLVNLSIADCACRASRAYLPVSTGKQSLSKPAIQPVARFPRTWDQRHLPLICLLFTRSTIICVPKYNPAAYIYLCVYTTCHVASLFATRSRHQSGYILVYECVYGCNSPALHSCVILRALRALASDSASDYFF
ncbi:unnamed protein product [Ceratitis capitata]|uniref:(Mediterranean fruit fly) hypothetical protein n=1 Tax=Ceratitis capitata TaxID=7213 RepID=A0A811V625_CERCA|nr:unnamed protein product [Ceratitis capitata]